MTSHPKHIAIILDGNRRWARKRGLPPSKGHEKGMERLGKLLNWAKEFDIKELTLYCFSTENFSRPKEEVDFLMNMFVNKFNDLKNDKALNEQKIRIRAIGRLSLFSQEIQKKIKELEEKTKKYDQHTVNVALGYGGRQEILDAVNTLREKETGEVTEEVLQRYLYLNSTPDILIRPGGEKRLSNFLTWQSVYSELFFVDELWPDFSKKQFKSIIGQYQKRERRYGS